MTDVDVAAQAPGVASNLTLEPAAEPLLVPVDPNERISSVDVLRGVALLGILLMNILEFGLPLGAELNPTIAGGSTGLNLVSWFLNHLLFEGKMRAIFSMLFGAGAVLLTSRAERRRGGIEVADIYYRRTLWLIAFGLFHAYFIWDGDILFTYGLFGLALFPLRNARPAVLTVVGLMILIPLTFGCLAEANAMRFLRQKSADAERAAASGQLLTEQQYEDRRAWNEKLNGLHQQPAEIAKEYEDHRSGYWTMFLRRAQTVPGTQSTDLYRFGVFDACGMMVLGMAFLKFGVFSAALPRRSYLRLCIIGYVIGIPLNAVTAYFYYRSGFDPVYLMYHYSTYQFSRLLVALGHIAVVMLLLQAGVLPSLAKAIGAVGRIGAHELCRHERHLHFPVQRLRAWPVRSSNASPAARGCSNCVVPPAVRQPGLVAVFSIRSFRVVMAVAYLLALGTDGPASR